jgi:hypothetical protein
VGAVREKDASPTVFETLAKLERLGVAFAMVKD